jgi:hypothetical protein
MDDGLGKEVMAVFQEIIMFMVSALGLLAVTREFLRRGHNLGLWP